MNVSADIGALFLAVSLCLVPAGDGRTAEVGQTALDTSLISCVRRGDADKVAELLQRGANPKAANTSGMTALQYAAMTGHLEILKMLISKGAEVNTRDTSGGTPIRAAAGRNAEAVKLLLEAGATPHPEALGFACFRNNGEAVALLLKAGVSPDAGIVQAAQGRNVKLLRLLLDKGAKVNTRFSKSGNTALHSAASRGVREAIKLLLKEGADPNAKNDRGRTPLHLAVSGHCDINSVKLLIDAGSKLDIPDNEGVTPIRHAAIRGQAEAYKLLLAAGGGVERRASQEQTPTPGRHPKSTVELIADLASKNYATRQAAETALVARGSSIMPEVLRSIESGTDMGRFYELFQKMGPDAEAALPKLKSLLGDKKHVFAAAMTLERMKPGSLDALPKDLRDKAAASLYEAAITPKVEDEMIRGFCIEFMYRFGDVATPYILKLLRSDNPRYRDVAAQCIDLAFFHAAAVEKELIKLLGADDDLKVRHGAARALGKGRIVSEEAKAALLALIRNTPPPDPQDPLAYDEKKARRNYELHNLIRAAAGSLGKAGPSIIDDLIPMLSPMDAPERRAAMVALRSMGAPAVPRLIELLAHEDTAVATSASVALNRIGRPAVAALTKALASRDEQVIVRATSALWWIGTGAKKAVPALLEVAGSEDRSDIERLAAARAALRIDGEGARNTKAVLSTIPVLIRTLEEGRFQHQGWAAETLRGIGPAAREALPMLRKRLVLPGKGADTGGLVSEYVRREAEQAISAIEAILPDEPAANP